MNDDELRRLAEEDFFVGYFPMSAGQKRFAAAVTAAMVVLVLAAGAAAAWFQRNPGERLAPYQRNQELTGVLVDAPYPMLRTRDEDGTVRHVLLVTGAKFVWRLPAGTRGTAATLRGNLLERDGQRMLEVFGRADAEVADAAALAALAPDPVGEVALSGEIVDSKCFYGRMRPGGGRTHRACAQLCVAGGIPPVLVTRDADGEERFYVLASRDGRSVAADVLPFIAEPVRVRGTLERVGSDLNVLRIDPRDIQRL